MPPTSCSPGRSVDSVAAVRELLPYDAENVTGPFGAGGVDYAFECVGHPDVLNAALEMLDWGGTAVIIGVPCARPRRCRARIGHLTHVERNLIGSPRRVAPARTTTSRSSSSCTSRGRLKLDELVTQTYALDDWQSCVHDLQAGKLARGVLQLSDA